MSSTLRLEYRVRNWSSTMVLSSFVLWWSSPLVCYTVCIQYFLHYVGLRTMRGSSILQLHIFKPFLTVKRLTWFSTANLRFLQQMILLWKSFPVKKVIWLKTKIDNIFINDTLLIVVVVLNVDLVLSLVSSQLFW